MNTQPFFRFLKPVMLAIVTGISLAWWAAILQFTANLSIAFTNMTTMTNNVLYGALTITAVLALVLYFTARVIASLLEYTQRIWKNVAEVRDEP